MLNKEHEARADTDTVARRAQRGIVETKTTNRRNRSGGGTWRPETWNRSRNRPLRTSPTSHTCSAHPQLRRTRSSPTPRRAPRESRRQQRACYIRVRAPNQRRRTQRQIGNTSPRGQARRIYSTYRVGIARLRIVYWRGRIVDSRSHKGKK